MSVIEHGDELQKVGSETTSSEEDSPHHLQLNIPKSKRFAGKVDDTPAGALHREIDEALHPSGAPVLATSGTKDRFTDSALAVAAVGTVPNAFARGHRTHRRGVFKGTSAENFGTAAAGLSAASAASGLTLPGGPLRQISFFPSEPATKARKVGGYGQDGRESAPARRTSTTPERPTKAKVPMLKAHVPLQERIQRDERLRRRQSHQPPHRPPPLLNPRLVPSLPTSPIANARSPHGRGRTCRTPSSPSSLSTTCSTTSTVNSRVSLASSTRIDDLPQNRISKRSGKYKSPHAGSRRDSSAGELAGAGGASSGYMDERERRSLSSGQTSPKIPSAAVARLCASCKSDFTRLRRPHKCRLCRLAVCAPCSVSRIRVPGFSEGQRACRLCVSKGVPASASVEIGYPVVTDDVTVAPRAGVPLEYGGGIGNAQRLAAFARTSTTIGSTASVMVKIQQEVVPRVRMHTLPGKRRESSENVKDVERIMDALDGDGEADIDHSGDGAGLHSGAGLEKKAIVVDNTQPHLPVRITPTSSLQAPPRPVSIFDGASLPRRTLVSPVKARNNDEKIGSGEWSTPPRGDRTTDVISPCSSTDHVESQSGVSAAVDSSDGDDSGDGAVQDTALLETPKNVRDVASGDCEAVISNNQLSAEDGNGCDDAVALCLDGRLQEEEVTQEDYVQAADSAGEAKDASETLDLDPAQEGVPSLARAKAAAENEKLSHSREIASKSEEVELPSAAAELRVVTNEKAPSSTISPSTFVSEVVLSEDSTVLPSVTSSGNYGESEAPVMPAAADYDEASGDESEVIAPASTEDAAAGQSLESKEHGGATEVSVQRADSGPGAALDGPLDFDEDSSRNQTESGFMVSSSCSPRAIAVEFLPPEGFNEGEIIRSQNRDDFQNGTCRAAADAIHVLSCSKELRAGEPSSQAPEGARLVEHTQAENDLAISTSPVCDDELQESPQEPGNEEPTPVASSSRQQYSRNTGGREGSREGNRMRVFAYEELGDGARSTSSNSFEGEEIPAMVISEIERPLPADRTACAAAAFALLASIDPDHDARVVEHAKGTLGHHASMKLLLPNHGELASNQHGVDMCAADAWSSSEEYRKALTSAQVEGSGAEIVSLLDDPEPSASNRGDKTAARTRGELDTTPVDRQKSQVQPKSGLVGDRRSGAVGSGDEQQQRKDNDNGRVASGARSIGEHGRRASGLSSAEIDSAHRTGNVFCDVGSDDSDNCDKEALLNMMENNAEALMMLPSTAGGLLRGDLADRPAEETTASGTKITAMATEAELNRTNVCLNSEATSERSTNERGVRGWLKWLNGVRRKGCSCFLG